MPGVQRWALLAAWGAFLATVPSALWRVLMIVGLLPGTAKLREFELAGDPVQGYVDVFALSGVQLIAGFLSIGLVRPWGERFLGRTILLAPVLAVAILGGLAVTWLFTITTIAQFSAGLRPDNALVSGIPLAIMVACYVPILFWGPLELVATAGYWKRRAGYRDAEQRVGNADRA